MRVAVIYSGAMRSFSNCFATQHWQVLRHFPGAKFYVACADDEDAWKVSILRNRYGMESVTSVALTQPEMVIPEGCPAQWNGPRSHYMHEPYAISVSPQAVLGQLWMLRQGWKLYEEANEPADLIIRIRPDLWFHSFEIPSVITNWDDPPAFTMAFGAVAFTPFWGKFGGCNDRFALLGPKAAAVYFTTYDHVSAMIADGAPLHPETLIRYSLERAGITIEDTLNAEFSTLRKTGEMRPPEILASDIAHYAKSN